MITFPMIPGVEINLFLMVFLSLAAGTISGFVGVGGGFIMTPALIIMGFPAQFAVGTGVLWVMGNSIIGTLRHRKLGNLDIKLGLIMIVFMMGGMEIGIRALNAATRAGMAETAVLSVSIVSLLLVGGSILWESAILRFRRKRKSTKETAASKNKPPRSLAKRISGFTVPPVIYFPRSGVRISLWIIMAVGTGAGILAGFIGVGGGFIIVPSLVYIFGVPSFMAVGTSLFQIIFPAAFGAARYTMEGNIPIFAVFIMIIGSSAGIYFGAQLTRYLHETAMKYTLACTILVAVFGSVIKVISLSCDPNSVALTTAMSVITFGGLAAIFILIIGLFIAATRRAKGHIVPEWVQPLLKD